MSPSKVRAPAAPARSDWTKPVDCFLKKIKGMAAPEAAARYGLGTAAIAGWRMRRNRGEPVTKVTVKYQEPLLRALESEGRAASIPIFGPIRLRTDRGVRKKAS